MGFYAKWPRVKCPTCGDPWEVGDDLAYNSESVVVHAQCALEPAVSKTAKEHPVCLECNVIHPLGENCEDW